MEKIFSTADVHPRDRFNYWHDVACRTIVSHEAKPESRHTFNAEMWLGKFADVELVLFENSPMAVSHTSVHCAQARSDELFVCREVAGTLALDQAGRETVLHPGGITLLDPLLPYSARFSSASRLLVLKVPRRDLEARLGKTSDVIMRPLQPTEAEQGFLSAFLAMLPAHAGTIDSPTGELVKALAVDLIAVSFARLLERQEPRLSCARSFVLVKVRSTIEARLTDPALDSATAAAAAGVSVRYANVLLDEEGTSIARLILSRRLERCRSAFADPSQNHRTISEIAFGWGFSDMTHFGRRFKAAYGQLPSAFRRHAQES